MEGADSTATHSHQHTMPKHTCMKNAPQHTKSLLSGILRLHSMFSVERERAMITQPFLVGTGEQSPTLGARLGLQPTTRGQDDS